MRASLSLVLLAACQPPGPDFNYGGGGGGGGEDGEVRLSLAENPNGPLAARASVSVEEAATVHVEFWSDAVGPYRTEESAEGTAFDLDVIGMRADSTYTMVAVATLPDGETWRSEEVAFTTPAIKDMVTAYAPSHTAAAPEGITLFSATSRTEGENPETETTWDPFLFGLDREGEVVWTYAPDDIPPGTTLPRLARLLPDGNLMLHLLYTIRIITPGGDTVAEWDAEEAGTHSFHHDAVLLPNGNIIAVETENEVVTVPLWEEPIKLLYDVLWEITPDNEVVWTWSTLDYLDPTRFPGELAQEINGRERLVDWSHVNALLYDEALDRLLVSVRHQNQIIAIDHGTGALLWTLGEDGDFDLTAGTWFKSQHGVAQPEPDQILLFDNGNEKDDPLSRAVCYRIDESKLTAKEIWTWSAGLFISSLGDAEPLSNGDVLVTAAGPRAPGEQGRIVEVTQEGDEVWEADITDDGWVFRATRLLWPAPVE